MKLAVEMAVMELDGEWNAVAVGEDSTKFHGMLRLNETAADIIKLLSEDTDAETINSELAKKYPDSSSDEIARFVSEFIGQLRKASLLTE
ncbi:MAG: PqqD family protein [Ruminococcus sp.]|uniref:Coenzyme PQQ synthesis protein D (PqqD) n=1 Tax=Ruminococcus albus TaxID=1264 RepID=A0A1H7LAJ8_RUMAL|nr:MULTISPECIES: PqqD family protein [Ruminococcus]MBO4865099.1 PqqD family protein [Ruminococcus sp.]SEK95961.1 Coenzyme PQQ synthesis protein D (PqqD) [Ruminococcus albus]